MSRTPEDATTAPVSSVSRRRLPLPTDIPVMQYMERFAGTLTRVRTAITPAWARDFPQLRFPQQPDPNYQLIRPEKLEALFNELNVSDEIRQRVKNDMQFMDRELLRLFKDRDFEAKYHQNRYRLYQLLYISLALLASIVAALQVMFQARDQQTATILAGVAGFIALTASAVAYLGDRRPSFMLWMEERRSAEHLRREYYRFLLNLPPYTTLDPVRRRMLLSTRAAQISGGSYSRPEDENINGGSR